MEINKAAYQIGGAKLLQGPDGMDDENHKDCALTHLIAQGIYYLQILVVPSMKNDYVVQVKCRKPSDQEPSQSS